MMNTEDANDQPKEHFKKIPDCVSDAADESHLLEEDQAATPTTSQLRLNDHETAGVKSISSPALIREDDTTTDVINANDAIIDGDDTATTTIRSMLQETFHVSDQPHSVSADTTPIRTTTVSSEVLNEENTTSATDNFTPSAAATEYYNHGLATWEKNRRQWLQRRRPTTNTHEEQNSTNYDLSQQQHEDSSTISHESRQHNRSHAKPINVDEIIDAIFSSHKKLLLNNGTSDQFPQSVPLPQLVDILQDLWEAESL